MKPTPDLDRALDMLCEAIDGDPESAGDLEAACRDAHVHKAVLAEIDSRVAALAALRALLE